MQHAFSARDVDMEDPIDPPSLNGLSDDLVHQVLCRLESPAALAAAASTNRRFRTLAEPASPLWRGLCEGRWQGPLNAHLFPEARNGATDWRSLLAEANGWRRPRLASPAPRSGALLYAGSSWEDEVSGLALQADARGADGAVLIAVASALSLRLLRLGAEPGSQLQQEAACGLARGEPRVASVAVVDAASGLLAVGTCRGQVQQYRLAPGGSLQGRAAEAVPAAARGLAESPRAVVTQLECPPPAARLLALHDSLAHPEPGGARSWFSLSDAATLAPLARATDLLDGYEVAAVAAPAAAPGSAAGPHESLLGSVRLSEEQASGWPCTRCAPGQHGALCYHKARSAAAALSVHDARAGEVVQRFSLGHRSLHPQLLPLRGHYLATSHAGTPVALWDQRRMSEPVHEVQHLHLHPSTVRSPGPGPAGGAGRGLGMALPPPEDPASTQALHLSAGPGGDWLLGRQDSGMVWLWDLSQRLGWADGSRPGSWLLRGSGVGSAEGQQHWLDESDWDAAPLALGCLPAPYECWSGGGGGAGPLHYLPREAAWVAGPGLVGLVGLDLEHKRALFPRHAQGAGAYPSNALAVCGLRAARARDAAVGG